MNHRYEEPPIQEAVCEFRFSYEGKWDLVVPGQLYERLKENFPNRSTRLLQQVETSNDEGKAQKTLRLAEAVMFATPSGKVFIQVAPRLLSVNCLRPYPEWQEFYTRIKQAFENLDGVLSGSGILDRIGLRYVNRIVIPEAEPSLPRYFKYYPHMAPAFPQPMQSFIVGTVVEFGKRDKCQITLADTQADHANESVALLDIDYSIDQANDLDLAKAIEWVDDAHTGVKVVFEGCIEDPLRALFKEIK